MSFLSKYQLCAYLLFAIFSVNNVVAAPSHDVPSPHSGTQEPSSGIWSQQGIDADGDGVLSGNENVPVFFFESAGEEAGQIVTFTLQVGGGSDVSFLDCGRPTQGDVLPPPCKAWVYSAPPGFHRRVNFPVSGMMGVYCEAGPAECAYTVSDVKP